MPATFQNTYLHITTRNYEVCLVVREGSYCISKHSLRLPDNLIISTGQTILRCTKGSRPSENNCYWYVALLRVAENKT